MINIVINGWKNSVKILFKYILILLIFILISLITSGCTASSNEINVVESKIQDKSNELVADVISVEVTGETGNYNFSIGILSPDEGCDQYTDWWEILAEDGTLLYRRILAHSHVNEQPFVRSGGPVIITEDTVVIIRAHMNPTGYGGKAMKGSINKGFYEIEIDPAFASEVESEEPQPGDCAF